MKKRRVVTVFWDNIVCYRWPEKKKQNYCTYFCWKEQNECREGIEKQDSRDDSMRANNCSSLWWDYSPVYACMTKPTSLSFNNHRVPSYQPIEGESDCEKPYRNKFEIDLS